MLEFGVTVAEDVNVVLLVAFNTNAVVVAVRLPPKLTFVAAIVVRTGVLAPPNDKPPLKLIVPAGAILVTVPELSVNN